MEALIYKGVGRVEIANVPRPVLRSSDEVLVRIEMSGICGTDHKIISGKLDVASSGTILGHEGVGTVVEVGESVTTLGLGDRVAINPTQSCLKCAQCRLGNYCYCEDFDAHQVGFSLPGTFAEFAVAKERWVYRLPVEMPWELASLAEPLGCCLNTIEKAAIRPWDRVLIIGGGPIGYMCSVLAKQKGATVALSEPAEFRRAFAEGLVDAVYEPNELEQSETLHFDVIIDAVGNQAGAVLRRLAKGGRFVPMGYDDTYEFLLTPTMMIDRGLSIIAAVPVHDAVGPGLALLEKHPELINLVTDVAPLAQFRQIFAVTMGKDLLTGERVSLGAMKGALRS